MAPTANPASQQPARPPQEQQSALLSTDLSRTLGISLPIWNAGMGGGAANSALAVAVSNAGGLGVLGTADLPQQEVAAEIDRIHAATDKPFGINILIPAAKEGEDLTRLAIAKKVPLIIYFWGDIEPHAKRIHDAGLQVGVQVGSVAEAREMVDQGADVVIFQGVEAGGHVRGTTPLSVGLPAVVAAVAPIPVVASGGIADGYGLAAALTLGAQAVSMGTRFLCTPESPVYGPYKERIVAAKAADTELTGLFDVTWPNAPHRVLRNRAIVEWESAGRPESGSRPGEGTAVGRMPLGGTMVDIPRYHFAMPLAGFEGDMELMCLHSGASCELIDDIAPAGEIVTRVAAQAADILTRRVMR